MGTDSLNIFYTYDKDEDIITHGFIAALHCISDNIALIIINKLLDGPNLNGRIIYDIQSPSLESELVFKKAKAGIILGISSLETEIIDDKSEHKKSRPDGWICVGNTLIVIESKLGPKISKDQLDRHKEQVKKSYGINNFKTDTNRVTWQFIDNTLKDIEGSSIITATEKNICSEFRRYLQMKGITLDLEKFFNATSKRNINIHWESNEPQTSLRLLKTNIFEKVKDKDNFIVDRKKEQVNETRRNYYWLRLFNKNIYQINWRSTLYINPDSVTIDLLAFDPRKKDIPVVIGKLLLIVKKMQEEDKNNSFRLWINISNYGKRRDVQRGRDYEYCVFNCNVEKSPNIFLDKDELISLSKSILPKQIAIKYSIANPGSNSTYWYKDDGNDVNHQDATILQNPEEVVRRFADFMNISLNEI